MRGAPVATSRRKNLAGKNRKAGFRSKIVQMRKFKRRADSGPQIPPFVLAMRMGTIPSDSEMRRRALASNGIIEPKSKTTDKLLVKWAKEVKLRDGYKCTNCNSTDRLHSHHIEPKSKRPDLKYKVENGIALCADCHANLHGGNISKGLRGFSPRGLQPTYCK